jgi:hypothetical protein
LLIRFCPGYLGRAVRSPEGKKPRKLEANTEGISVSTGKETFRRRACLPNYAQMLRLVREKARNFREACLTVSQRAHVVLSGQAAHAARDFKLKESGKHF